VGSGQPAALGSAGKTFRSRAFIAAPDSLSYLPAPVNHVVETRRRCLWRSPWRRWTPLGGRWPARSPEASSTASPRWPACLLCSPWDPSAPCSSPGPPPWSCCPGQRSVVVPTDDSPDTLVLAVLGSTSAACSVDNLALPSVEGIRSQDGNSGSKPLHWCRAVLFHWCTISLVYYFKFFLVA